MNASELAPYHCKNDCGLIEVADSGTFQIYNLILQGAILPTIAIFGFFGNLCSFWVFTRSEMRSVQLNRYFAALATSDAFVVVCSTFIFSIDAFQHAKLAQLLYVMFVPTLYPIAGIAHTSSIYFTIAADLHCFLEQCQDRIRCIKRMSYEKLAFFCCVIFGILSGAVAFNTTKMLEIHAVMCWGESHAEPKRVICVTDLGANPQYLTVYYLYMYPTIMVIGPMIILTLLTSVIIWSLIEKRRRHTAVTSETDCTSLVMVVLLFIGCNSLSLIQNFLETIDSAEIIEAMPYIIDISNTLVVLNSSLNFVIYLIFDPKFREIFIDEICCCSAKSARRELLKLANSTEFVNLTGAQDSPLLAVTPVAKHEDNHYANNLTYTFGMDDTLNHMTSRV